MIGETVSHYRVFEAPGAYRTVVETYPGAPAAELAHEKLAARTWESLAVNFPRNRPEGCGAPPGSTAKSLKDTGRAREASARVPSGSSRYADAQERLR